MMTSLSHLSGDAIGRIVDYLEGKTVFSLYKCGSTILNRKLVQETRNLTFRLANRSAMPTWAFKLPNVRDISIGLSLDILVYGRLQSWSLSQLPGEVARLERLELLFPSTSFLLDAAKDLTMLQRLFPSLKSLSLYRCQRDERIVPVLEHLPKNLTSFQLTTCNRAKESASIPFAFVSKLPRTLTDLEFTRFSIEVPEAYNEEMAKETWPPNLKRLAMYEFTKSAVANHLPAGLTDLSISWKDAGVEWAWKVSTLPKALLKLCVTASDYDFVFDVPFPSTLRELDVSPVTDLTESDLPDSLTRLPYPAANRLFGHIRDLIPAFSRFTHLLDIFLPPDSGSELAEDGKPLLSSIPLPPQLVELRTQRETRLSLLKLPQSIKILYLIGLHPDDVSSLPSGLEELQICDPDDEEEQDDTVTPWPRLTRDSLSAFPLYILHLWLDVRCLSEISNLGAIKRLYKLDILILYGLSYNHLQTSPPLFERDSLPHSITSLSLIDAKSMGMNGGVNYGVLPPSPDWLRLSDLSTLLPNLSTLHVEFPIRLGPNDLLGPTLATLPKSLLVLHLEIVSVFEETALSHLPQDLSRLSLYLTQIDPTPSAQNGEGAKEVKPFLSNPHFANLPENLAYFLAYLPRQYKLSPEQQFCSVDAGIIAILPKRLSCIYFNDFGIKMKGIQLAISEYHKNQFPEEESHP